MGDESYDDLLAQGEAAPVGVDSMAYLPDDEWDAIALNYVWHYREPQRCGLPSSRAYLNAVSNALSWHMGDHPVYLWTLPMFHCNDCGVPLDISGQCWRVGAFASGAR